MPLTVPPPVTVTRAGDPGVPPPPPPPLLLEWLLPPHAVSKPIDHKIRTEISSLFTGMLLQVNLGCGALTLGLNIPRHGAATRAGRYPKCPGINTSKLVEQQRGQRIRTQ